MTERPSTRRGRRNPGGKPTPGEPGAHPRPVAATVRTLSGAAPDALLHAAAFALCFLGAVAFFWVLYVARSVLMPAVAALIVGLVVAPVEEKLEKAGIPLAVGNMIILLNLIAAGYLSYLLLIPPLVEVAQNLPDHLAVIAGKTAEILQPLDDLQRQIAGTKAEPEKTLAASLNADLKSAVVYVLASVTPALWDIGMFLIFLVLLLMDRTQLKTSLVLGFKTRDERLEALRTLNQIERSLGLYLFTITLINLGVGAATAASMYLAGVPGPVVIGAAAFIANYVPYVGPAAMQLLLVLLGIALFPNLAQGLLPFALYAAIVVIESSFITPYVVGKRFTIRPLIVFGGLAFWTWLWGLAGGLLAMPIMVIVSLIMDRLQAQEKTELP